MRYSYQLARPSRNREGPPRTYYLILDDEAKQVLGTCAREDNAQQITAALNDSEARKVAQKLSP